MRCPRQHCNGSLYLSEQTYQQKLPELCCTLCARHFVYPSEGLVELHCKVADAETRSKVDQPLQQSEEVEG